MKRGQELQIETLKDFPREVKILGLQLQKKSNDINANTFIPLVLFNRKETVKTIHDSKDDIEKLQKVI
jgi:hypothetical protein